jgi:hypothetical protein
MEHIVISSILTFNIILMVVYFIFRMNRRSLDRTNFLNEKAIEEAADNTITDEKKGEIVQLIATSNIPSIYEKLPSFHFLIDSTELVFINKGELEKGSNEFGVIIKAGKNAINFSPLSILESNRKNIRYIKNDTNTILGLFTPFHVILIDTVTWKCAQSAEDETDVPVEEILVTSYTKDNVPVEHYRLKIKTPFVEPALFIEKYYVNEFSIFLKRLKQK